MSEELEIESVRAIAKLARLDLDDDEAERIRRDLSVVLGHVEAIQALDTEGVEPMAHAIALSNVWRSDVEVLCLDRDEVLAAAPEVASGRFKVPAILGEEL